MAQYLVTGGAGFIGRYLCQELLEHGHQVRVLDALVPQVHENGRKTLSPDVELVEGDVRDPSRVRAALEHVDGVFHLAAEVGVGQSMYEIARYTGANDLGTAVLLECVMASPVRRLVVASSMSVYGEGRYRDASGRLRDGRRDDRIGPGRWDPADGEGRPLEPVATDERKVPDLASIYALTKYVQERACLITAQAYRFDAVALRLFNVFGPGQALGNPYTGVLANFGARLANGRRPTVFEDGEQRRDFVHVRDVATAFRLAMEAPAASGAVINIGSGRSYSIRHVAELLANAMGRPDLDAEILGRARAGDIRHCFADIGKAQAVLDFKPQRRLEDSLDEIVDWIVAAAPTDRGAEARHQLETRGLVA